MHVRGEWEGKGPIGKSSLQQNLQTSSVFGPHTRPPWDEVCFTPGVIGPIGLVHWDGTGVKG